MQIFYVQGKGGRVNVEIYLALMYFILLGRVNDAYCLERELKHFGLELRDFVEKTNEWRTELKSIAHNEYGYSIFLATFKISHQLNDWDCQENIHYIIYIETF